MFSKLSNRTKLCTPGITTSFISSTKATGESIMVCATGSECMWPHSHRVKDPASFRYGDVVEVGFAMIAYRSFSQEAGERYKCHLVMRSLTLLDSSIATVSSRVATLTAKLTLFTGSSHCQCIQQTNENGGAEKRGSNQAFTG